MNAGAGAVSEFDVAGQEVGVEVGKEDVLDVPAGGLGVLEILVNVALGIDDGGGLGAFVGDDVGGVGEASQVVLFDDHDELLWRTGYRGSADDIGGEIPGGSVRGLPAIFRRRHGLRDRREVVSSSFLVEQYESESKVISEVEIT